MVVEFRLRWVGYVWRRPVGFIVKRVDLMKCYPIARG